MKYGDPTAVRAIAENMVASLLSHRAFLEHVDRHQNELHIASSAYGSIPTAAHAIMQEVVAALQQKRPSIRLQIIKIGREGGFDQLDYSKLDASGREHAMRTRRIYLEDGVAEQIEGKLLLVVDDLRSTGAHERAIHDLVLQKTAVAQVVFAYSIAFNKKLGQQVPNHEERINHCDIKSLPDLIPLFLDQDNPICLNARLLKFILRRGLDQKGNLEAFAFQIGKRNTLRIYNASISNDGYFHREHFRNGFKALEDLLLHEHWIETRRSVAARNCQEGKIVAYNITSNPDRGFCCAASGVSLDAVVKRYSRFKFGDADEIRWWGKVIAAQVLQELSAPGNKMRKMFDTAQAKGEHVFLVAPGIRNVVSSSNFLLREVGSRVNIWLSQHGLPTMIMKTLTRLGSGRANYAELSANDRGNRDKSTQTLIPRSAYHEYPIHVVFVDDVEVTGSTIDRARMKSLEAGARSFHAILGMRVDPAVAHEWPSVEQTLNQFEVDGSLDTVVRNILCHLDFHPVQRLLRLLLHPDNQNQLQDFLPTLPTYTLTRVYEGAMSNDYLWINSKQAGQVGIYGPSLKVLQAYMEKKCLVDSNGLLIV